MFREISSAKYEIISPDVESTPVWYVTNTGQGVQFEVNQLWLMENIGALVRPKWRRQDFYWGGANDVGVWGAARENISGTMPSTLAINATNAPFIG